MLGVCIFSNLCAKLLSKVVEPMYVPTSSGRSSCFPTSLLALTDFHLIFDNRMGVKWYGKFLIDILLISSEAERLFMFVNYFICFLSDEMPAHNLCAFLYYFLLFY